MQFALSSQQQEDQAAFADFVSQHVTPCAGQWDHDQSLPDSLVRRLAQARYLVATLPRQAGGLGLDMPTYGLLNEEIGRGCGSVRNLVAVQGMVAHAILRWGTAKQADRWVPRLGAGEVVAAFALTEPGTGSDARNCTTTARRAAGGYVLTGRKKWISFGRRAGLFLVFAQLDGDMAAFLVERGTPGLRSRPIMDLLGLRASELAELAFDGCVVPAENVVSRGRLTFDAVAMTSLDYGRYSTACGCVGLAQGCLDASLSYARERTQFGVALADHQLVQRLLADMICGVSAARLLCREAGTLRENHDPDAVRRTLIAKYVASTTAFRVASDAVQIHGANGCGADFPVERHLRDAKIAEIIEGTSQIQQLQIADLTLTARPAAPGPTAAPGRPQ